MSRKDNKKSIEDLNFEENKNYIVLGMHRSGTSFIAKALYDQGVDMGKNIQFGSNPFNKLGHFENQDFVFLDNEIIGATSQIWDDPPSDEKIEAQVKTRTDKIKSTIDKNKSKFWGWKHPTSVFTVDHYLPHIDGDTYLVCVFRKPDKVAESLLRRDGKPMNWGRSLAKQYNRKLIEVIKKFAEID